ncbi:MAG: ShlB/FhaC/HecB family hemolysin secretion/activation protein [Stellaceae bacterium]
MPALAQARLQPFPGQAEPGRNVPPPAPPAVPQFEFSIPAPQRGPVPRAVDEIEFNVSNIVIVGAKQFTAADFKPLIAPLIGHNAKLSDIVGVADKIESLYRAHGFVLTRAFVPPQTVSNGVFRINVVEGYVRAAAVNGGDTALRERVEAYVAPATKERPATLGSIERGLLLANDLPGVTAAGLLRPSPTEAGASDLLINLAQVPWQVTIYSDNRGGESTGVYTLGAQLVANQLYLIPGQLSFDVSGTPGLNQRRLFQLNYALPVGLSGTILNFAGVLAHGVPAALSGNLVSDSYALSARVDYPLIVSRATRVTLEGGLSVQAETVSLAGGGAAIDDDNWRDAEAAVTLHKHGLLLESDTGATFGVTQGIPSFGSTTSSGEDVSTSFTKYTLVAQHDQPLVGPVSASFHALGQYTRERLMIGEQTSFGGSGIGRGYDPAALSGDIGLGVASELRYDVHLPRYYIDTAQFYLFFDAAKVRGHGQATSNESLLSTGLGVRVALLQALSGGVEFAQELRGVPNVDQGRTGARILFNAAVRF